MKLEEIAATYGMIDYYDPCTGYTYYLSKAMPTKDDRLKIPVTYVCNKFGSIPIGYAMMDKVEM